MAVGGALLQDAHARVRRHRVRAGARRRRAGEAIARRQGRPLGLLRCGQQQTHGCVLRVHCKQLQIGHHALQLGDIAERVAASGDQVKSYIDIKLSVSESRYTNWPPALQQQFAAARTVDAGKPSFTLTLDEEVL